jgi:hypothetical protein
VDSPIAGALGAVCVVLTALVAIIAVYSVRRQRRDRDRMRQWADHNGWTVTLNPSVDWGRRMPGGNRNGVGHTFTRVLHGRQVSVAEYSVTDASDGTTTNTHYYVIMVARLSRSLPTTNVELRPRTSRLAVRVRGAGETATGNADFDRAYRVQTTEPTTLNQWLSPRLITAYLARRQPGSWGVRGTELFCYSPGRLTADEIPGHAATALSLADLLDGSHAA